MSQGDIEEHIKEKREPMKFFYSRVSTSAQEQAQFRQKTPDDVPSDNVFREVASGKDFKRPKYKSMIERLKAGDTLYIWSIDRFGRNLIDLAKQVEELKAMGVRIVSIDDHQTIDPDDDDPTQELFWKQLALFAEFQRKMMLKQQAQGIARAKEEDALKPPEERRWKGRKPSLDYDKIAALYRGGFNISQIAKDLDCDRKSVRNALVSMNIYEPPAPTPDMQ